LWFAIVSVTKRNLVLFVATVALAWLALALARSSRPASHKIAAGMLVAQAVPFAYLALKRIAFARGVGLERVADSPAGYVLGVVVEALFLAPLLAFAIAVWRFRARGQTASSSSKAA